jgi:hypothetical protein
MPVRSESRLNNPYFDPQLGVKSSLQLEQHQKFTNLRLSLRARGLLRPALHGVDPIHFPVSDGSLASQPARQRKCETALRPHTSFNTQYELDLHPSKSFLFLLSSDITSMCFQTAFINQPISLPDMFKNYTSELNGQPILV